MTKIQIPASRSEFTTFVELTSNQMFTLRRELCFSSDELDLTYNSDSAQVTVSEALVAEVLHAAALFKADSTISSKDKAAVTRLANVLLDGFEKAYESLLRRFQADLKSARVEVARGANIDGWKLSWESRNDDRIEVTYATFEESAYGRSWKRNMTNCETIRPEFTIGENGEPSMKFVVCESGFSSIRDTDPRFETLAEAKAHALVLIDWTAALCYERLAAYVAEVAAELAQVELTLSLLSVAGVSVDHLVAA